MSRDSAPGHESLRGCSSLLTGLRNYWRVKDAKNQQETARRNDSSSARRKRNRKKS